ncbi:MAG: hypothetical protein CM15mP85_28650 [Rhodobacterales bacterium]|nr:MAG: hypothetical protein CM15mP85_28650 [Rhodobacterales bacterium]
MLPELHGKLDGTALRVPTPNVSAVDLTFEASIPVTVEDVNSVVEKAALNDMVKVLDMIPNLKFLLISTIQHILVFLPQSKQKSWVNIRSCFSLVR